MLLQCSEGRPLLLPTSTLWPESKRHRSVPHPDQILPSASTPTLSAGVRESQSKENRSPVLCTRARPCRVARYTPLSPAGAVLPPPMLAPPVISIGSPASIFTACSPSRR